MKLTTASILTFTALALAGGCKKKQEAAPASGSGSAAPAGSAAAPAAKVAEPAAPAGDCAGGEWKDPNGLFCVKLPTGWTFEKIGPEEYGMTDYSFNGPEDSSGSFSIRVSTATANEPYELKKASLLEETPTVKISDKTDIAGGKGLYGAWLNSEDKSQGTASLVDATPKGKLVYCKTSGDDIKPADICKTLRPL